MRLGYALRITKREWIALGGCASTRTFRKMRGRAWAYYLIVS